MDKASKYKELLPQIKSLLENENDIIANLSNLSSAIHFAFNFHWTGFYLVKEKQLILGPFQGPVACTRIPYGKGVCGVAWKDKSTIIVNDVHQFEGHIACSALSQSEIVVPIFSSTNEVWGVLDIDSEHLSTFDALDQHYLQHIVNLIKFD
jgi:L-methionine (R)-S-oxide reductase